MCTSTCEDMCYVWKSAWLLPSMFVLTINSVSVDTYMNIIHQRNNLGTLEVEV